MIRLHSPGEVEKAGRQELAVIFKHSTRCPISSSALAEMTRSEASYSGLPFYLIHVVEDQEASLHVAARWGIPHRSPQLILLKGGEAVWNVSHYDVTARALGRQVEELQPGLEEKPETTGQ